jgi:DNA polymerase bacteriophage-type
VILTLPNGRELHYPRVKFDRDQFDRDKLCLYNAMEHKWEFTWGGTLTENIVQAFCRDLLMEAMLRLHDQGFVTSHRIHDELVLCVPEDQAEAAKQAAEREMSRTPAWAPGLPLGAECKIASLYGK